MILKIKNKAFFQAFNFQNQILSAYVTTITCTENQNFKFFYWK